jgi:hypothetical protein
LASCKKKEIDEKLTLSNNFLAARIFEFPDFFEKAQDKNPGFSGTPGFPKCQLKTNFL